MIIAANFKTNMTRASTKKYLNALSECEEIKRQRVIVIPPATALQDTLEGVELAVQNAYSVRNGAFTGELGLEQLEEFNVNTVLIGHSERRHVLGESQEEIAKKYEYFKNEGFSIIYCLGESEAIRDEGEEALEAYMQTQLDGIDTNYEKLIVAYEPVWAIGTGRVPTNEQIVDALSFLGTKTEAPLLYGGSVKAENSKEILHLNGCDGILVGGASLKVEDFCTMIKNAK